MDFKRFEEARTHVLAHQKPLVSLLVTFETPFSLHEPTMVVINHQSNCSISSLRKKSSGKKRKVSNYFDSSSAQGETEVELVDANEQAPIRKVRKVGWLELELVEALVGCEFGLDNLWYFQLDYGPFMR